MILNALWATAHLYQKNIGNNIETRIAQIA
jgi:hypothetical protein